VLSPPQWKLKAIYTLPQHYSILISNPLGGIHVVSVLSVRHLHSDNIVPYHFVLVTPFTPEWGEKNCGKCFFQDHTK